LGASCTIALGEAALPRAAASTRPHLRSWRAGPAFCSQSAQEFGQDHTCRLVGIEHRWIKVGDSYLIAELCAEAFREIGTPFAEVRRPSDYEAEATCDSKTGNKEHGDSESEDRDTDGR